MRLFQFLIQSAACVVVTVSANPIVQNSAVADANVKPVPMEHGRMNLNKRDDGDIENYDPDNGDDSDDYSSAPVVIGVASTSSSYTSAPGVWKGCAYEMDDGHRFTSRLHVANNSWSEGNFSKSNAGARYFNRANTTNIAYWNPSNVVIDGTGILRLISSAVPTSSSETMSQAGEIHSGWYDIVSASVRTVAKGTIYAPGTVYGMFFYGLDDWHNETDIELRTGYTHTPYFTNQYDHHGYAPSNTTNVTFSNSKSITDWHEYRIDYLPGSVSFYIDGVLRLTKTILAPSGPGQWRWNSWSNSNPHWSQGPSRQTNNFFIASIDMYANRTGVTCGAQSY